LSCLSISLIFVSDFTTPTIPSVIRMAPKTPVVTPERVIIGERGPLYLEYRRTSLASR
jgi:hypothetical protein